MKNICVILDIVLVVSSRIVKSYSYSLFILVNIGFPLTIFIAILFCSRYKMIIISRLFYIYNSFMPSSNQRSSSSRPSRTLENRLQLQTIRTSSVPQRQFIFILTNNPELLRQTRAFQPQVNHQKIRFNFVRNLLVYLND